MIHHTTHRAASTPFFVTAATRRVHYYSRLYVTARRVCVNTSQIRASMCVRKVYLAPCIYADTRDTPLKGFRTKYQDRDLCRRRGRKGRRRDVAIDFRKFSSVKCCDYKISNTGYRTVSLRLLRRGDLAGYLNSHNSICQRVASEHPRYAYMKDRHLF